MIYKSIVLSCFVLLSFLFLDVLACKGEEIDNLRLDADYNSILDYQPTQICADPKDLFCTEKKDVVQYLYITNSVVVDDLDEWVDERTLNTRVYEKNGKRSYRVYSGQPFIKTGDVWFETGVNYVDTATWDSYTKSTLTEEIISKLNPFRIYSLNAQEILYAGSGDGNVASANAVWASCRAGSSLTTNKVATEGNAYVDDSNIRNLFYPFDLSSVSGEIESANFNFYTPQNNVACNDTSVAFNIIESSATTTTELYTSNWTPPNYTILSTEKSCSELLALASSEKVTYTLNATAITQMEADSLFGLEFTTNNYIEDLGDPSSSSYIDSYFSEQSGTTYDPYLEITVAEEQATTTATSTVYNTYCIPEENEDVTKITACSYISSTTGITYTNYQIPFIIWIVVALPFFWVGSRLLLEYLIRLRVIFN